MRGVYPIMNEKEDCKRAYWHSRRGMLEIDLVLLPFVEERYPGLNAQDKLDYKALLESEDTELFAWFLQRSVPDQPQLARMVKMILEHARTRELSP